MIDKEKQIEEMAKEIEYAKGSVETWHCRDINCEKCEYKNCKNSAIAEHLIENGWVKLLEDSIIVSKEEWKENHDLAFISGEKEGSKETAEKIYKDLKLLVPDNALGILTRYFKEIMDVEIN